MNGVRTGCTLPSHVIKHGTRDHGAAQQAETAGETLDTREVAVRGPGEDGEPKVSVGKAFERSRCEQLIEVRQLLRVCHREHSTNFAIAGFYRQPVVTNQVPLSVSLKIFDR